MVSLNVLFFWLCILRLSIAKEVWKYDLYTADPKRFERCESSPLGVANIAEIVQGYHGGNKMAYTEQAMIAGRAVAISDKYIETQKHLIQAIDDMTALVEMAQVYQAQGSRKVEDPKICKKYRAEAGIINSKLTHNMLHVAPEEDIFRYTSNNKLSLSLPLQSSQN